jgi:peptide/nickel transport system permease protein
VGREAGLRRGVSRPFRVLALMQRFILIGILRMFAVLFILSMIAFVVLHTTGDPALLMVPPEATQQDVENVRRALWLDKPLHIRYFQYLSRMIRGDFGKSLKYGQPAFQMVLDRFPNTIELTFAALLIASLLGIPMGIFLATRVGSFTDAIGLALVVLTRSMPGFWVGLMSISIFSVRLKLLPTSGKGSWQHLILPATTLSAAFLAHMVILVRAGMVEILQEDFVRTARSKGLRERTVLIRHALRNVLIPVVTYVGLIFGRLLGGAVITETVFAWPGIGRLAVAGIYSRDFPLVQACLIFLCVSIVLSNLLVEILYGLLDPRVRTG